MPSLRQVRYLTSTLQRNPERVHVIILPSVNPVTNVQSSMVRGARRLGGHGTWEYSTYEEVVWVERTWMTPERAPGGLSGGCAYGDCEWHQNAVSQASRRICPYSFMDRDHVNYKRQFICTSEKIPVFPPFYHPPSPFASLGDQPSIVYSLIFSPQKRHTMSEDSFQAAEEEVAVQTIELSSAATSQQLPSNECTFATPSSLSSASEYIPTSATPSVSGGAESSLANQTNDARGRSRHSGSPGSDRRRRSLEAPPPGTPAGCRECQHQEHKQRQPKKGIPSGVVRDSKGRFSSKKRHDRKLRERGMRGSRPVCANSLVLRFHCFEMEVNQVCISSCMPLLPVELMLVANRTVRTQPRRLLRRG